MLICPPIDRVQRGADDKRSRYNPFLIYILLKSVNHFWCCVSIPLTPTEVSGQNPPFLFGPDHNLSAWFNQKRCAPPFFMPNHAPGCDHFRRGTKSLGAFGVK